MRLFIAIALPPALREELAALVIGMPGARWVAAENMHLTLRFLGEVNPAEAEDLDAALCVLRAEPVTVSLQGIGTFGHGRRVHALWVAVGRDPALMHLQGRVEAAAVHAGFPPERRKFTPHVTLARLKNPNPARLEGFIAAYNDHAFPPFIADEIVLFESHLTHDGAYYEALERYSLAGRS